MSGFIYLSISANRRAIDFLYASHLFPIAIVKAGNMNEDGSLASDSPLMQPATAQECAQGIDVTEAAGVEPLSGHLQALSPPQRHCTAPMATACSGSLPLLIDHLWTPSTAACGANSLLEGGHDGEAQLSTQHS